MRGRDGAAAERARQRRRAALERGARSRRGAGDPRLEHGEALGHAALERIQEVEQLEDPDVVGSRAARLLERRAGGLRRGERAREESRALELEPDAARAFGLEREPRLERRTPRQMAARALVERRDALQHLTVPGQPARETFEPGERRVAAELLRRERRALLEQGDAPLRLTGSDACRRALERGEHAAPVAAAGERLAQARERDGLVRVVCERRLEAGDRLVRSRERPGEERAASRVEERAVGGARGASLRLREERLVHGRRPDALRQGERARERLGVPRRDLEHAPQMRQRVLRPPERPLEEARELEPERDLDATDHARDLRLEQQGERRRLAQLSVEVAERALRGAVVGPIRERLPHGLGRAREIAGAAQGVGDAEAPAHPLRREPARRSCPARESDQRLVAPEALVEIRERLGHHRERLVVLGGRCERRGGALGVGQRARLERGDAEAERGRGAGLFGQIREPFPQHGGEVGVALLALEAARQVLDGRHRARLEREHRLPVTLRALRVHEALGRELGQAMVQEQRALGVRSGSELGLEHARVVLGAIELVVEQGEALQHVAAPGLERGRGFEVRGRRLAVVQPIAAEEGEPAAELRVVRGGRAAEARLERGREAGVVPGALEQREQAGLRLLGDGARAVREIGEERARIGEAAQRLLQQARAFEELRRSALRVGAVRRVLLEELGQPARVPGAAQCPLERRARSFVLGQRLAHQVEERDGGVGPVEPVEQQLGAAQIDREGLGRERVEPRAA